jgi:hypothetical protein
VSASSAFRANSFSLGMMVGERNGLVHAPRRSVGSTTYTRPAQFNSCVFFPRLVQSLGESRQMSLLATTTVATLRPNGRLTKVLAAGLVAQLAAVAYYWIYFQSEGYLPAPFIYNKFDTFMDLYNTLWWGAGPGKYTLWQSVYPPINFLLLDFVRWAFFGGANMASSIELRELSLWPAYVLSAYYVLAPFMIVATEPWREIFTIRNRMMIALFAAASQPFLFSLERGNLIVLALLALPAVFSKRIVIQIVGIAFLINLKPYFALLLLGYAISREWRVLLAAISASGVVFVATGLVTDPDFPLFLSNLLSFSQNEAVLSGREVLAFPSSLSAFTYAINIAIRNSGDGGAALQALGLLARLIEIAKWSGILLLLFSLLIANSRVRRDEVMASLIVVVIGMGIWAGGYSQIFYLACLPTLIRMRLGRIQALILFVVFLPLDCVTLFEERLGLTVSFLQSEIIDLNWQFSLGSMIRPLANFVLVISLSVDVFARLPNSKSGSHDISFKRIAVS